MFHEIIMYGNLLMGRVVYLVKKNALDLYSILKPLAFLIVHSFGAKNSFWYLSQLKCYNYFNHISVNCAILYSEYSVSEFWICSIQSYVLLCKKKKFSTVEKEKSCVRQWSAPQFNLPRRTPSKLNLGSFASSVFPGMDSHVLFYLVNLYPWCSMRSSQ